MPRAWARAWAASCSRVPRTSAGVRRSPSPLIMISAHCSPCDVPAAGGVVPQRGCLPSVPLAMMMTAGGISGCQRRISSQMSSRTFRIRLAAWEPLLCADPFPARVPLPDLVYPDHVSSVPEVGASGAVEPVVAAAPVRVGEGVVGFGDLPELLSGVAGCCSRPGGIAWPACGRPS